MTQPTIIYIISNIFGALSFFAIASQVLYFRMNRKDLSPTLNGMLLLFFSFIMSCGIYRACNIWNIFHFTMWFFPWLDAFIALVLSITAIRMLPMGAILMREESGESLRAKIKEYETLLISTPSAILEDCRVVSVSYPIATPDIGEIMRKIDGLEAQLRIREFAFQHAHDPMVVTLTSLDPTKVVIALVNKAYCELVGFEPAELVGHPAAETLSGPETNFEEWRKTNEAIQNGEHYVGQGVLYLKRGPTKVEWSCSPISMNNGPCECAVSTLRII